MKKLYMILLASLAIRFNTEAIPQNISNYWGIIARSSDIHIINSNDLKSHLLDVESSARNGLYYYQIPVVETLKGTMLSTIKIRIYLEQDFIEYIRELPGNTKLISFLTNRYARFRLSGEDEFSNYIAGGNYDEGIIIYTDEIYREIVDEIKNQQVILQEKLYESFIRDEAMDRKIKGCIDELVIEQKEMTAFDELLMMGVSAVPYIISHMDDYRELPIKYARLFIDDPDWFESMVQYGPELVIDTLGVILMGLTRENFGRIWSNSTNEERQRALDGWRIYLYYYFSRTGSASE